MINLLICGIGGKMGTIVYQTVSKKSEMKVIGGVDGAELNNFSCPVYKNFDEIKEKADIIIDFSRPEAIDGILNYALKNKCGVVLATTGYSTSELDKINNASKQIPVFMSANYSLGINLLATLCKVAAKTLGLDYDIEIIEKHHNQKIDAPSGTALMLANEINTVFDNDKNFVYGREGKNCKRTQKEIGIHAVRGGTIVGEHEILFTANDETITLSHSAQSRQILASGAVRAAEFLNGKTPKIYSMTDLIG